MKRQWIWIAALSLSGADSAYAQGYHPSPKWELSPFVGYETSGSFPITDVTTPFTINRLRADSGLSYGSFLDYSFSDNFQFELMWSRNSTTFSERNGITGIYTKAFDSDIDLYHFGVLYMFRSPDAKLRPYVAGGLGFSHQFNSGATPNRTDFSFGMGGGVKYFPTQHFGFRGDLRYVPAYANSSPGTYCDPFGFCYPANVPNYLNRVNVMGGIVFRF